MDSKPTVSPDEQPKRKVAKQVITQKRQYFVPHYGSVEATSAEEAGEIANKKSVSKEEDGDAK